MRLPALILACLLTITSFASTPASFRGKIVEFPAGKNATPGTIFVAGPNGSLRRVAVGSALVVYAEGIPAKFRQKQPTNSLKHGAEVRVEAEENGHGLWRARSIEILAVPGSEPRADQKPKSWKRDGSSSTPVLAHRS